MTKARSDVSIPAKAPTPRRNPETYVMPPTLSTHCCDAGSVGPSLHKTGHEYEAQSEGLLTDFRGRTGIIVLPVPSEL